MFLEDLRDNYDILDQLKKGYRMAMPDIRKEFAEPENKKKLGTVYKVH